ncbi:MAG: hypothetical protein LBI29_04730 [Rickettsiales bacterium]|jgi:hypothetical protein|nr:hypothetical protein [Rickettsiales bacterium]
MEISLTKTPEVISKEVLKNKNVLVLGSSTSVNGSIAEAKNSSSTKEQGQTAPKIRKRSTGMQKT